jgi:hypothetical protein
MSDALVPFTGRARRAIPGIVAGVTLSEIARSIAPYLPSAKAVGSALGEAHAGYKHAKTSKGHSYASDMKNMSMAPVSISTRHITRKASIRSNPKMTTVTHRELVGSAVTGSTGFNVTASYALNPGLATSFPWLSVQAQQFQEYRFRKLCYEYVPIAPTSTQGDVTLCVDYDSSNPPPTSEVQASDLSGTIVDSCWKPIMIRLNPSALHAIGPRKFIRSGNSYGDLKTFDSGNFYLCTENETGTTTIGKLYVSYTVEFFTPFNGPYQYTKASGTSSYGLCTSAQTLGSGVQTNVLFDTPFCNALNLTLTSGVFTPPAGFYKIEAILTITDTASETLTIVGNVTKNAANLPVTASTYPRVQAAGVAGSTQTFTVVGYTSCNGTDTISIFVEAIGTAGTLTLPIDGQVVNFTLA